MSNKVDGVVKKSKIFTPLNDGKSFIQGVYVAEARSGVFIKISLYRSKHHVAVGKATAFRNKAKKFLALL